MLLAYQFVFINGGLGNPATLIIYPATVVVLSGLQARALCAWGGGGRVCVRGRAVGIVLCVMKDTEFEKL